MEVAGEPTKLHRYRGFFSSCLAAFFHLQNQKSVNGATGTCFYSSTRIPVGVKWSSADQALVESGTSLPPKKLSVSSTWFWPALTTSPKLCLLRFAQCIVQRLLCCRANVFSDLAVSELACGVQDWKLQTDKAACAWATMLKFRPVLKSFPQLVGIVSSSLPGVKWVPVEVCF